MKKTFLIAALCALLAPTPSFAAEYELSLAHGLGTTHPQNIALIELAAALKAESNGRIEIHIYDNGTLVKNPGLLKAVSSGGADIVLFSPAFSPADFPHMLAHTMNYLCDDAYHSTRLAQAMVQLPEGKLDFERNNVQLLTIWSASSPGIIAKRPIRAVQDLAGKRVMAVQEVLCKELESWGATSIQIVPQDMYVGLQRGLGEAAYVNLPQIFSQKAHEQGKYLTTLPSSFVCTMLIMNKKLYDSMPEDVRALLNKHLGMGKSEFLTKCNEDYIHAELEAAQKTGIERIEIKGEALVPWKEASLRVLDPYWEDVLRRGNVADPKGWMTTVRNLADKVR